MVPGLEKEREKKKGNQKLTLQIWWIRQRHMLDRRHRNGPMMLPCVDLDRMPARDGGRRA